MKTVQLVPMAEADFKAYRAQVIPEYADEQVRTGNWTPQEARARAEQQFQELLPKGVATEHHYLFSVLAAENGAKVGLLWVALNARGGRRTAFIYDCVVFEAHRRQGYGQAALRALEAMARGWSVQSIGLHVFAHNTGAQALYQKAGYVVTDRQMSKRLETGEAKR